MNFIDLDLKTGKSKKASEQLKKITRSKTSKKSQKATLPKPKNTKAKSGQGTQSKNPHKMNDKTKKVFYKAWTDYKTPRAILGFWDGITSATLGTKMSAGNKNIDTKKLYQSGSYKAGNIGGNMAGYGLGYGGVGKVAGKAATKVVTSQTGKRLVSKAAKAGLMKSAARKTLTKAGQNATTKAVEHAAKKQAANVAKGLVKGAVADATVGTFMNSQSARADGMKVGSKEWKKHMAESAALDFVTGGAVEIAPTALKALKKGSGKKTVQRVVDGKVKNVKVDKTYMDFAQESQKNALSKSKKAVETAQNEYIAAQNKLSKVENSLQSKAAKKTENVAKLNAMRQKKLSAAEKKFKQAELKLEKTQHTYDNAMKATLPEQKANQKVKAPAPRSFNEAKAALQKKALLPTEKTSYVKAEHVAPEHKATFNQYVNATDRELKQFVENSRNGVRKKKDFKDFSAVGQREAADVKAVTGVDVSGYKHRLKTSTIQEHIDTRHGANGKADMSMADSNDIARMGYVLDDYDTIELLRNQDGTPLKSREFSNSDQTQASMVRFSKRIDGHYYVAVAVPDSNSKTLNIVSAYIKKPTPKVSAPTHQVVLWQTPLTLRPKRPLIWLDLIIVYPTQQQKATMNSLIHCIKTLAQIHINTPQRI